MRVNFLGLWFYTVLTILVGLTFGWGWAFVPFGFGVLVTLVAFWNESA